MKPKWEDAPAWAMALAMDVSGCWLWHERRPLKARGCGIWDSLGKISKAGWCGGCRAAWEQSLEERP